MLQLNTISVKNHIVYNKATLHIEPGVTTIRGKNLDRKAKNASNGAGKSLIPSVIPGIVYDSTPLPMKAKKNPKEGFVKGTEQNLFVTDKFNNKFCIKKYFQSSVKLDLIKNDKPLKFRKKTDAKERLVKLIPLNEDQFYSLVYLDTKRSPVFQYGTDAQRHHFIESLYKLNIYDSLSAKLKVQWDKNKELIQELEILDNQLSLKVDENPGDPEELRAKQAVLLKKVEQLRDRVSDLLHKLQECRTFEALTDGLDLTKSLDQLKEELSDNKAKFSKLKKKLTAAKENNQKYEAFKTMQEKQQELERKLSKVEDVDIDKSIQQKLREDRTLLNSVVETQSRNKEIEAELVELKGLKFELSEKYKTQALGMKLDALKRSLIKETTKLKEAESNLEDTKEHLLGDHQNCPVCSSNLSEKVIKSIIKDKEYKVEKLSDRIVKIKGMVKFAENVASIKELESQIVEVEDINKIEKRIDRNEMLVDKMRKKILLTAQLKDLPDIEKVSLIDTKSLENNYDRLEKIVLGLDKQVGKHENLERLSLPFKTLKQAKTKKSEYENALEEYRPLLDKLQSKSHNLNSELTKSEILSKDIEELSKSVNGLKLKTGNHKILTALRKAFGAKGIRRQRVSQIGIAIEDSLNKYAKMLFDFPIKFQLVITDTKFQILAHRNNVVSDVRSLSGAESKYFSLLTLVSLLPFCPTSQRIDTVILDELEANLDEAFRQRYITIFLPELLKIVPKVIIITPLSERELFIPKAKNYVVIKKDGKSILTRVS